MAIEEGLVERIERMATDLAKAEMEVFHLRQVLIYVRDYSNDPHVVRAAKRGLKEED